AQLGHDLVHLPQPRGADGFAVGDAPAVGVDRQPAVDFGGARRDHFLLRSGYTEPAFGHMHDLRTALGVLELRDADLTRADTGLFECRRGGVGADTGRFTGALDSGTEHLE